jgi:hypothetical protein
MDREVSRAKNNKGGVEMIKNETNKQYHSTIAISKSSLMPISVNPAFFKWVLTNKQEPTKELIVGRAFHKIVLEPSSFQDEIFVMPTVDKRTKMGKEQYDLAVIEAGDRDIISDEDFIVINDMKDSLKTNKYAVALLSKGDTEQSIYWTDELTQIECKCRPDYFRTIQDRILITDLKSCRKADMQSIIKDVVRLGYDLQAGMYCEGISKEFNVPKENIDFIFIFVEKEPPYLINIVQANRFIIERGNALFRQYLGTYKECLETDNWYGYNGATGSPNELTLPNYLLNNLD